VVNSAILGYLRSSFIKLIEEIHTNLWKRVIIRRNLII